MVVRKWPSLSPLTATRGYEPNFARISEAAEQGRDRTKTDWATPAKDVVDPRMLPSSLRGSHFYRVSRG